MPELDLSRDLDQYIDILPADRLHALEALAKSKQLTDTALTRELGRRGLALAALCLTTLSGETARQVDAPGYLQKISAIREHLAAHAPSLLQDSRVVSIAENLIEDSAVDEAAPQNALYHDIGGIRSVPLYVDFDAGLVPLVRTEILDDERRIIASFAVRLHDLAFLSEAFLENVSRSLESVAAVNRKQLLDKREILLVQERIVEIEKKMKQIRARVDAVMRDDAPQA